MADFKVLPEMQELSDQIGEFVYYWGFKRIHGKIWTHLYLAKKPLDAADIVNNLDISKALVSISLRELMEYEVIQFAGKSERGTQLYKINPDILSVIMSVLRQREKRMLAHIQAAHEGLTRSTEADRSEAGLSTDHLMHLGELVQKAVVGLDGLIALKAVDFSDWQHLLDLGGTMSPTSVMSPAQAQPTLQQPAD
jgi:DNA-binding transcriptional regulator GbsR (MarR family)